MNFKHLLFGFICTLFILNSINVRSQNKPVFETGNLKKKLQERLEKQNIPENDSIAVLFSTMFASIPTPDQEVLLNTLNYLDRKIIINRIIDEGKHLNSKGDSIKFEKSILYVTLETSMFYNTKSPSILYEWLLKAKDLLEGKNTTVTDFINFISRTYFFNKGYLRKSNLINWKYKDANYSVKYNSRNHKLIYSIPQTDLECNYRGADTLIIHKSKIEFNPLNDSVLVNSGTVQWADRFGADFASSYVELGKCAINLKHSGYKAAKARYYNSTILKGAVTGDFEDGTSKWSKVTKYMPKFESYQKNVELISDKKNFRFFGGLSIEGNKLQISGNNKNPAELRFYQNGKLFFKSKSLKMEFFSAENADITIYTGSKDSIWHPACTYRINDKGFYVSRLSKGKGGNFFQISDIKMETNMRTINWQTGSDSIKFLYGDLAAININKDMFSFEHEFEKQLGKINKTIFRSINYFNIKEFEKLKMFETQNPLFGIRKLCTKKGTRTFYLDEYSGYVKKNPTELKLRLLDLSYKGFLEYDELNDKITVKQKLFDHLDYYTRKKDYDELEVVSPGTKDKWKEMTAVYNLKKHTLDIGGVESVILSNSQRAAFKLDSTYLTVERNRNMKFAGRFQAGLLQFVNGQYSFDYDKFMVTIDTAEQMMYSELRQDKNNSLYALPVTSAIYDVKGTVHIDSSLNKSGRFLKTGKEYPRFSTNKYSYVYYNEEGLADFDPNNFYFKIYPYTQKNLNFITAGNLKLKGEMHTGGMLPVFKETLKLIYDDYEVSDKQTKETYKMNLASLGFIHNLEGDNVPLFEKGTFGKNAKGKSVVSLSRAGFKGQGKVDWLTSQIQADEFNFFSNNIAARAANFTVSESRDDERYPLLSAKNVTVQWNAKEEKVTCQTDKGDKMNIFNGKVKMEGTTVYTPKYLMGKGLAEYEDTDFSSDSIIFRENSFYAEKGNFRVYEPKSNRKKMLFETHNMKNYTDMKAKKTVLENIDTSSYVDIISNKYNSFPTSMMWDHQDQKAELNQPLSKHADPQKTKNRALLDSIYMVKHVKFSPGIFYGKTDSLKMQSKKDGLIFYGTNANYDGSKKQITMQDVKRIMVADIYVIPSSKIKIEADGNLEKLQKTRIEVLNDSNALVHEITDVDIDVKGKNSYVAKSGTYKYRNATGEDQNVFFNKITYDETKDASIASGYIKEDRSFMLNSYFVFKGGVEFNAKRDFLTFNGYAKMKDFCNYKGDWFFFKNEINPKDVVIKLNKNLMSDSTKNQANIYADIKFIQDSTALTPAFLRTAPDTRDNSIFSARQNNYVVTYQPKHNRYIAAPEECINDTMPLYDYIAYETNNCLVKTYSKINYANIPHTKFKAVGNSNYDLRSNRFRINSFAIFDFWFNNDASKIMAETIKTQLPSTPTEINDKFKKDLELAVGKKTTDKYYNALNTQKSLPEPLDSRMIFSELNFYWDNEEGAFMSLGDISLMAVNNIQVNQKVKAKIKITSGFKNDEIRIYLYTQKDWFYFRFFDTNMYTYSSVPDFNKAIEETKLRKRKDPKSRLRYILCDKNEAAMFFDNF